MIHVAVLHFHKPEPETGEDRMIFASLDGEDYLPVNREPVAGDEEAIAQLFEGDGNFRPMHWNKRAMHPVWWPGKPGEGVQRVEKYTVNEEAAPVGTASDH
jgi:hypothetical protein